ncbi:hypothetical protein GCM10011487_02450 [Steroidobacter agaridevorans]|uniref:Uncharacterized protein n=1 Tax=Steroidobacter agaridevorans TaxID=2695856 RepID=A0A829Y5G0_9GAMM|nr:hypothetical protein [Steroidobacter agaridevorans]GFE78245.1 hypothetical protein GCM10011487_02450 [Steroidobacter agaridevorans]GFE91302.1 hypothetical protein GCM10011488_62560 [Steroidobacter agaridevorans]
MNTLSKSLSIAAATVALAVPFATQASSYDAAMDSCINAFVASSLPKEQPVRIKKDAGVNSPLSVHSRAYKIVVSAKGVESGKYFARGTCIVDRSGAVIALNGKPLTQKLASR